MSISGSKSFSFSTSRLERTGSGKIGAGVAQFEFQAHGFGGDQNVGEDDDGVDAEQAKGLQRDFDGEIWSLANL